MERCLCLPVKANRSKHWFCFTTPVYEWQAHLCINKLHAAPFIPLALNSPSCFVLFFLSELQPPAWIFVNMSAMNHPYAAFTHTDESLGAIIFITQGSSGHGQQLKNNEFKKNHSIEKQSPENTFHMCPRCSRALTDHWCPHLLPI